MSEGGRGGKALLVESDVAQLASLEAALSKYDYHCATFTTAEAALQNCEPLLLDVAIIDTDLAGIDGIDLGTRLKAMVGPELFLPIVIVSRKSDVDTRLKAYRAGCDDYLSKPLNHFELSVRVDALVNRKRQQSELVQLNAALKCAQKRRSDLAALIVHDLRNPMAAILGNTQLLEEWVPQTEIAQHQCIRDIKEVGLRSLSMINGLLDVEEMEGGILKANRSQTNLSDFAHHFPSFYESVTRVRKLSLLLDIDPALEATFDRELIGRIIENLLDNSVRYATRGGKIVVRAFAEKADLVIEVGNTGTAVPEFERTRMFDRYYRLEEGRKGSRSNRGLGLYFCRLAAEAHEGNIQVVSRPELAACFIVRLPGCVTTPG